MTKFNWATRKRRIIQSLNRGHTINCITKRLMSRLSAWSRLLSKTASLSTLRKSKGHRTAFSMVKQTRHRHQRRTWGGIITCSCRMRKWTPCPPSGTLSTSPESRPASRSCQAQKYRATSTHKLSTRGNSPLRKASHQTNPTKWRPREAPSSKAP